MGLSKKEERGEVVLHSVETFQRMALGFIPGGHVVDEFLNFRSKLKQKRILDFSGNLMKALEEFGEIDPKDFSTKEFVDVFESVMSKVVNSSNEFKLKRFKNILVKDIVEPVKDPLIFKYISILDNLNEIQLLILEAMYGRSYPTKVDFVHLLIKNETGQNSGDFYFNLDRNNLKLKIGSEEIVTSKDDLDFYVTELVSNGLLNLKVEETVTKIPNNIIGENVEDRRTNNLHFISPMGKKFIEFIMEY